jgi:hypothetical protein
MGRHPSRHDLPLPCEAARRAGSVTGVLLMGVPLSPSLVLELADLLKDERLAAQLRAAHAQRVVAFALEPEEAEAILSVLDDPSPGFEELRAVLLREIEPRRAEGL